MFLHFSEGSFSLEGLSHIRYLKSQHGFMVQAHYDHRDHPLILFGSPGKVEAMNILTEVQEVLEKHYTRLPEQKSCVIEET